MNVDHHHPQQGPAAAVVVNGDTDTTTTTTTDNEEDDPDGAAAVNRVLHELLSRMQNGAILGDRDNAAAGKLSSILSKRKEFPYRQRNTIRALVTEFVRSLDEQNDDDDDNDDENLGVLIQTFLDDLGRDIREMLCDQTYEETEYYGLDSSRDTDEELRTAIRFFPENLTATSGWQDNVPIMCVQVVWDKYGEDRYSNTKAVGFVHVLAELAIEFNAFEDEERGGLLFNNYDYGSGDLTLKLLIQSHRGGDDDYHQHADKVFVEELIRLRQMDLFKKEDIQRYDLVLESSSQGQCGKYFPERRFRFLVQMDPYSLLNHYADVFRGHLPLHEAAKNMSFFAPCTAIPGLQQTKLKSQKGFRSVFDAVMRAFPYHNGIASLFRIGGLPFAGPDTTPFKLACLCQSGTSADKMKHRQGVMNIIEDTITRYSDATPINTKHALILAATDATIHLDGVFFLLRRQPDVLVPLLRQQQPQTTNTGAT